MADPARFMTRRSRSFAPDKRSGGGPSAGAWVALMVVVLGAVAVWQFVVRPRSIEPFLKTIGIEQKAK